MSKSARDIPRGSIDRDYGHLPPAALSDWAINQAELSEKYQERIIVGSSETADGLARKQAMLARVREALEKRSNMNSQQIEARMAEVNTHLEDPGLLVNFEYFDIPSSDFMLQFYFAMWDRRIAELMGYVHNYAKDLKGVVRPVPEDDIWYHMSHFEAMNINERKKARSVVDFINAHGIKRATSFGGGDIPERLYGLPGDLHLTVFDDGPVRSLAELFPNAKARQNINYIHEPLSNALAHKELLGTQQLVWMHGVSMYLDEATKHQMSGAILLGAALLGPGGYMKYDYLVWTESIRRVIRTQNWPYDPKHPMVIFRDAASAIEQGRSTLSAVNAQLGGEAYMDALDPEVTLVEPWGVTSVRFVVQKHV